MRSLVFDLYGDYACFKTPDGTRGNMTFPFPSKTALVGILAAILGYDRNVYWDDSFSICKSKIAIEILQPGKLVSECFNWLSTSGKKERGMITQQRLMLLQNSRFRIYVYLDDDAVLEELIYRIENGRYCYPIYMGHANMFANINLVGVYNTVEMSEGVYKVSTLVPKNVTVESGSYDVIYGVPTGMQIDTDSRQMVKPEAPVDLLYFKEPIEIFSKNIYRVEDKNVYFI